MKAVELNFDPDIQYQSMNVTLSPNGTEISMRIELRYMEIPDRWYLSAFNRETDKPFFTFVPMIGSGRDAYINLLSPFTHKRIGSLFCIPVVKEPSSPDPCKDNLDEFAIVWGDNL